MFELGMLAMIGGAAIGVAALALVALVAVRTAVWVVLLPLRLLFGVLLLPLALLVALPILAIGLGISLAGGLVLLTVLAVFLAPLFLLGGIIWLATRHRTVPAPATPAA
ncbi:MAG: hypothetical protein KGN76_12515 [Acidobacteriota bacterium]|nr:hypothetical protein [Acidobacteriota bacterium]